MATVYISSKYKDIAERLGKAETKMSGKRVFPTYMHLMIFAAMVGYSEKKSGAVKDRGPEIEDGVFIRHNQDALVYLLALDAEKDGEILRDSNEAKCWRFIEGYADSGFEAIEQWFLDRPSDVDGVETIISKMVEVASEKVKKETNVMTPDVDF